MRILLADFHKYIGYSGGIENVLSKMARAMTERGHAVSAAFADEKEGVPFFSLPEEVHLYNLYHMNGMAPVRPGAAGKILREIFRAVSRKAARNQNYRMLLAAADSLRKVLAMEKPDVIVSFREPTGRMLLSGIGTEIPVVSMLHNDPDEIFAHAPEGETAALARSFAVQALLPSFIEKAKIYMPFARYVSIPNAIEAPERLTDPGAARKIHRITCVGRLTGRTKRQHLLIEAFAPLAREYPDWQVDFWGALYDKPYVASLKARIKAAGLEKQVFLRGTTKKMDAVWKETDIFAFPSHHEGFPLALGEAMARGIPSVGYKSCPAVNELIQHEKTGFLCEEGTAPFTEALRRLMESASLRRAYGADGAKVMEAYRPEAVWDKWEALLQEAAAKK